MINVRNKTIKQCFFYISIFHVNMRHNTKKGIKLLRSKRYGTTRRVQRGGALIPVIDKDLPIGAYDDETGIGRAEYEDSIYEGHFVNGVPNGQGRLTYKDGTEYEGETYEGHFLNGVPHEQGRLTYKDGSVYEGELNQRELTRGKIIFSDGDVYEGEFLNNIMNGQGKMTYASGGVYDGKWLDGLKHGEGELKYADGREYNGQWANDKINGKGKLINPSGSSYDGDWVNQQMHGQGTYTFADGKQYVGNLVNDEFTGPGIMRYANGDVYEGNWRNDHMYDPNGRYTFANGDVQFGNWINHGIHGVGLYEDELNEDGFANGHGKCTFINGNVYEGMWYANYMHNHGSMKYANDDVYEGPWYYGLRHGDGKMTYADGRVYEGDWWNDDIHGDGKMTAANGDVIYEGLWRDNQQNPLFNPNTGELADNAEYNATLARPPKIFPMSDNMLYQSDTYKYEYHDMMELQDKIVLEALEEDPDAIAFKVNRTYYVVSIHDIVRVANNKNYIQYECPIVVDLDVNQSDMERVIKNEPYFSIHGMGTQLAGVVPLFDIWSAIKSGYRAFELVGTRRLLKSTATHHVMFKYGKLSSSNHCQSGIPATVYELQMLRIANKPRRKTRKTRKINRN